MLLLMIRPARPTPLKVYYPTYPLARRTQL